jgi:hypothetical protein
MEAGQMKSLVDWDAYVRDFHPDLDLQSVDNVWKWNRTKPLTLAFFIQQLQAKKLVKDFEYLEPSSPFRVVILGGNPEEEENALGFWGDALEKALHLVEKDRRLDIVMIGPQVSPERHNTSVDLTPRLRITFYKGRFHDYREDLVDDKKYEDPHMFLAYHRCLHHHLHLHLHQHPLRVFLSPCSSCGCQWLPLLHRVVDEHPRGPVQRRRRGLLHLARPPG